MTAGTKAILLLSVLGMIVLVAWYGNGPGPALDETAGTSGAARPSDPLLAADTEPPRSQPVARISRPAPPPMSASATPLSSLTLAPPASPAAAPPAAAWLPLETLRPAAGQSTTRMIEMGSLLPSSVVVPQRRSGSPVVRAGAGIGSPGSAAGAPISNRSTALPRATAARQRTHTVRPGDTLGHIAQEYYGAASQWHRIVAANTGIDPDRLRVGDELKIPAAPKRKASTTRSRSVADLPPLKGRTYTIGEGETLSSIADDQLGHEKHWYRIYELNKERIGSNPDRLVVGMVVAIPG